MPQPTEILILSQEPDRARQWMRYLTGPSTRLWQNAAAIPTDVSIDVIVTDRVVSDDLLPNQRLTKPLAVGEIGIVGIGWEDSADACLPGDFTARELRLACSLLSETVRLRRETNRSRRMQEALTDLAMTDPLTGLPNRRAWDDELMQRGLSEDDPSVCLCVALLDLDHFKAVNDRFGHLAGDCLLRHVGQQLASIANEFSFVARLGGDEFAVLFSGSRPSDLAAEIEKIRIFACREAPHHVTASVGLAVTSEPVECNPLSLLSAADAALRKAKTTGRNRSVVVDAVGHTDRPSAGRNVPPP